MNQDSGMKLTSLATVGLLLIGLLLAAIVLVPQPTQAAIVVEDVQTGQSKKSTSLTISNVVVSGTDRVLYVFISALTKGTGTGANEPDSVVWDAAGVDEALTQVGFINTNKLASMIYVKIAPTAKTADVTVSDASNNWNWNGAVAAAVAMTGVHQTTPDDGYNSNSGTSSTSTVDVASDTNDLVMDVTAAKQTTCSVGSGQSQMWNVLETQVRGCGSNETGGGTVTMDWTLGASTDWSSSGIAVNPTAAPGPTCEDLTVVITNPSGQLFFNATTDTPSGGLWQEENVSEDYQAQLSTSAVNVTNDDTVGVCDVTLELLTNPGTGRTMKFNTTSTAPNPGVNSVPVGSNVTVVSGLGIGATQAIWLWIDLADSQGGQATPTLRVDTKTASQ